MLAAVGQLIDLVQEVSVTTNGAAGAGKNWFENSALGRILLPALIFQSVAIGGAYATGREAVEYGGKYGALGWLAGVALFTGLTVTACLMFELARKFGLFDYRNLLKKLVGPLYWIFDVLYVMLALVIIGVLVSATGEILKTTLGLNYWIGVVLVVVLVSIVNYYGEGVIERFNGLGTVLLCLGYVLFAVLAISSNWDQMLNTLATGDHSLHPGVSLWEVVRTGLVYAGLYLVIFPATLFTIRRQRRTSDSMVSGVVLGVLIVVPWFLTYFSLMGFYPDPKVLEAPLPWLAMLQGHGFWVTVVFGILVGWTLFATAIGLIHATLQRVSQNLVDFGRAPLGRRSSGLITALTLVIAILLARVGIIDLVAKGYTAGAYAMIAILGIPLLIRGTYLIVTRKGTTESPNEPVAAAEQADRR